MVQGIADALLERVIQPQLLVHASSGRDFPSFLHAGCAIEVEDPLDQLVRVVQLVARLILDLLEQPLISPVLAHSRVEHVLVDRRQLAGEELVQEPEDLGIALHESLRRRRRGGLEADS